MNNVFNYVVSLTMPHSRHTRLEVRVIKSRTWGKKSPYKDRLIFSSGNM